MQANDWVWLQGKLRQVRSRYQVGCGVWIIGTGGRRDERWPRDLVRLATPEEITAAQLVVLAGWALASLGWRDVLAP